MRFVVVTVGEGRGRGEGRGIVEVDIDVAGMMIVGWGIRVTFAEAMAHFAVGRADGVGDEVAEEEVGIVHFGEFGGGEVLEESGAFANDGRDGPGCACVGGGVEGAGVEPEAVEGAAEGVTFKVGEEAAVGVVVFPLFERVDIFVALGDSTGLDDLLKERLRDGYLASNVGRLRCVLCQKL
jgi:hypothetical protein